MTALPIELWRTIMLLDPVVYRTLALTCSGFRVDDAIAKRTFCRKIIECRKSRGRPIETYTGYQLPSGWFHSIDDQPAITDYDGGKRWYVDNALHRDNGPAHITPSGSKLWYKHNRLHRIDGPAIMWSDGSEAWYVDDIAQK